MSTVLLGGTGFIGRHLCEALHRQGRAAATISYTPNSAFLKRFAPSIRGLEANSTEADEALEQANVVIYLAHRSRPASHTGMPHLEIESNVVEAARTFSDIARRNPQCRIIYASSGGQIYGPGHDAPIPESAPTLPVTPYGLGKLHVEQCLGFLHRSTGIPTTILRMGNPVGKWQLRGTHGLVAAAVRAAHSGDTLTIYGDGTNQRDYFDADDLASFICTLSASEGTASDTYNIGSGTGKTEQHIIELVEHTLGRKIDVRRQAPRPFDLPYAVLDISKARRELGWNPTTPIEQSIAKIDVGMADSLIFQ